MSFSVVQQTEECFCNCASHQHGSFGVGLPLIKLPYHHHHGATTGASTNISTHNSTHNWNQFSSSISSQEHTFSSSAAISTTCVNCSGQGHASGTIVEPIAYPFKGGHVKHTHASYHRESIAELNSSASTTTSANVTGTQVANGHAQVDTDKVQHTASKGIGSWTCCVPISIPLGLSNATLESLVYTVRYASSGAGSACVQTDVVVSNGGIKASEGIITDYSKLALYAHYGSDEKSGKGKRYGPPMLNEALGLSLASIPAFKNAGDVGGWSHYLDHQKIHPNIRIGENYSYAAHATHSYAEACHVYLFFHVYEYPGAEAMRSISVDVSATWNDGVELTKLREQRAREMLEMRQERERLIVVKREMEELVTRIAVVSKRANEEYVKRMKGEEILEKEFKEREMEFIAIEKHAKESYEQRTKEEVARLKLIEEAETKSKLEHERRMLEEDVRFKALSEAEKKAEIEHIRRMKEEAEGLRAIDEAEERAKAEYIKRTREEEGRFKALSEAERKAEFEHERRMREEADGLRAINEAERLAKEEFMKRSREEEARFLSLDQAEKKAKIEYEQRLKVEETRLKELESAEIHAKEAYEIRIREERTRLVELEEIQQKIIQERDLLARERAERIAREEAEEAERKARKEAEDAERRVREEARLKEIERRKREEMERARAQLERLEREQREAAERKKREEEAAKSRVVPSVSDAPPVADEKMQEHIAEAAARLGQKCKNGYAWEKKAHGYKCSGGGHFISFKDLGMQ